MIACEITPQHLMRVSVSDTGMGLAPALVEQPFQPFNRLGQEASGAEGTGIGLVVTKQLVELMGGQSGVQSEVGAGSTFWFDLPLAAVATPTTRGAGATKLTARALRGADCARRTLLYIRGCHLRLRRTAEHVSVWWR